GHGGTAVKVVSGLSINLTYELSVSGAAAGFKPALDYAVNALQGMFSTPVTLNIDIGYGSENGNSLGSGVLGQTQPGDVDNPTYSAVRQALISMGAPGASTLPLSQGTGTFEMAVAQEKALGLIDGNSGPTYDGYVGFATSTALLLFGGAWSFT